MSLIYLYPLYLVDLIVFRKFDLCENEILCRAPVGV